MQTRGNDPECTTERNGEENMEERFRVTEERMGNSVSPLLGGLFRDRPDKLLEAECKGEKLLGCLSPPSEVKEKEERLYGTNKSWRHLSLGDLPRKKCYHIFFRQKDEDVVQDLQWHQRRKSVGEEINEGKSKYCFFLILNWKLLKPFEEITVTLYWVIIAYI